MAANHFKLNRQTLVVRTENAFCKFHTFFGFVYHVSRLPWFETKHKIRCIDAPEVCIYTPQKSTRIWKVYLNYSKCTRKVSILLYKHHTIIEPRATRHSAVSAFTETVKFLECSLALINAYEILLQHDWLLFFLDIIGSQKRIATYNFHII